MEFPKEGTQKPKPKRGRPRAIILSSSSSSKSQKIKIVQNPDIIGFVKRKFGETDGEKVGETFGKRQKITPGSSIPEKNVPQRLENFPVTSKFGHRRSSSFSRALLSPETLPTVLKPTKTYSRKSLTEPKISGKISKDFEEKIFGNRESFIGTSLLELSTEEQIDLPKNLEKPKNDDELFDPKILESPLDLNKGLKRPPKELELVEKSSETKFQISRNVEMVQTKISWNRDKGSSEMGIISLESGKSPLKIEKREISSSEFEDNSSKRGIGSSEIGENSSKLEISFSEFGEYSSKCGIDSSESGENSSKRSSSSELGKTSPNPSEIKENSLNREESSLETGKTGSSSKIGGISSDIVEASSKIAPNTKFDVNLKDDSFAPKITKNAPNFPGGSGIVSNPGVASKTNPSSSRNFDIDPNSYKPNESSIFSSPNLSGSKDSKKPVVKIKGVQNIGGVQKIIVENRPKKMKIDWDQYIDKNISNEEAEFYLHRNRRKFVKVIEDRKEVLRKQRAKSADGEKVVQNIPRNEPLVEENIEEKSVKNVEHSEKSAKNVTLSEKFVKTVALSEYSSETFVLPEKSSEKVEVLEKSAINVVPLENFSKNVVFPEKSVKYVVLPDKSIEKALHLEKSVKAMELQEKSVKNVELPEKSVKDVEPPEKSVKNVKLPEKSVKNVELQEKSVKNVELPEKSVKHVELPEEFTKSEILPEKSMKTIEFSEKSVKNVVPTQNSSEHMLLPEKSSEDTLLPEKILGFKNQNVLKETSENTPILTDQTPEAQQIPSPKKIPKKSHEKIEKGSPEKNRNTEKPLVYSDRRSKPKVPQTRKPRYGTKYQTDNTRKITEKQIIEKNLAEQIQVTIQTEKVVKNKNETTDVSTKKNRKKVLLKFFEDHKFTVRNMQRVNYVLKSVKEEKIIVDTWRLVKGIRDLEAEEGAKTSVDKKSVHRLLTKIAEYGLIKYRKATIKSNEVIKNIQVVCDPNHNDDDVIMSAILEEAKIKFVLTGKDETPDEPQEKEKEDEFQTFDEENVNVTEKDKPQYKFNRHLAKAYGYCPKFGRCRKLHELLFYLVYADETQFEHVSDPHEIDKIFEPHGGTTKIFEDTTQSPIFSKEITWKTFIPPVKPTADYPKGWIMISDILLRLPLSILTSIFQLQYEIPNLTDFLSHPVKKHFLVQNLPSSIKRGLFFARKFTPTLIENLRMLCYLGLVRFGPQKTKNRDQVYVYLNQKASLYNTVKSGSGYHQITENDYKKHSYTFENFSDIEQFWYDMWSICANTPLGHRNAVAGEYILLDNPMTKKELLESLHPILPEDAQKLDDGTIPGDRRGAAGFDSCLFAHLKRNWSWLNSMNTIHEGDFSKNFDGRIDKQKDKGFGEPPFETSGNDRKGSGKKGKGSTKKRGLKAKFGGGLEEFAGGSEEFAGGTEEFGGLDEFEGGSEDWDGHEFSEVQQQEINVFSIEKCGDSPDISKISSLSGHSGASSRTDSKTGGSPTQAVATESSSGNSSGLTANLDGTAVKTDVIDSKSNLRQDISNKKLGPSKKSLGFDLPRFKVRRKQMIREVPLRKPQNKIRNKGKEYDDIDRICLSNMKKLRTDWSELEDHIILLCAIASEYLCPNYRKQSIERSVVRDVLHKIVAYSNDKTSLAVHRRVRYILKHPKTSKSYVMCLEEIKHCPFVEQKFGSIKKKYQKGPIPNSIIRIAFVELVAFLSQKFSRMHIKHFVIPDTLVELRSKYDIVSQKRGLLPKPVFSDVTSIYDIECDTVRSVIHSSLCSSKDKTSWAFQLFKIYQQYPETLLRAVISKIRSDQLASMKKAALLKIRSSTSSILQSPFKLSIKYQVLLQNTQFRYEGLLEANAFVQKFIPWLQSLEFEDENGENVTEKEGLGALGNSDRLGFPKMEISEVSGCEKMEISEVSCSENTEVLGSGTFKTIGSGTFKTIGSGTLKTIGSENSEVLGSENLDNPDLGSKNSVISEASGFKNLEKLNYGSVDLQSPEIGSVNLKTQEIGSVSFKYLEIGSATLKNPEVGSVSLKNPEIGSVKSPKNREMGSVNLENQEVGSENHKNPEAFGSKNLENPELGSENKNSTSNTSENLRISNPLENPNNSNSSPSENPKISNPSSSENPKNPSSNSPSKKRNTKTRQENPSKSKTTSDFRFDITYSDHGTSLILPNLLEKLHLEPVFEHPDQVIILDPILKADSTYERILNKYYEILQAQTNLVNLQEDENSDEENVPKHLGESTQINSEIGELEVKQASRIGFHMTRAALMDRSDKNNVQHMHDYFVVQASKVFLKPMGVAEGLRWDLEVRKISSEVLKEIRAKIILPEGYSKSIFEEIRDLFPQLTLGVADFEYVEKVRFEIHNSKELGMTLTEIKNIVPDSRNLNLTYKHVIEALERFHIILRVGTTCLRFVHFDFKKPWVTHADKILRLEKEKLSKDLLPKTKWKGKRPLKSDSNPKDPKDNRKIKILVAPWVRLDGSLNRRVLDRWLGKLISTCVENAGISLQNLIEKINLLKPTETIFLVGTLIKIGCVRLIKLKKPKVTLFSEISDYGFETADILDEPNEVLVEPTVDAFLNFAAFVGNKSYNCNFID